MCHQYYYTRDCFVSFFFAVVCRFSSNKELLLFAILLRFSVSNNRHHLECVIKWQIAAETITSINVDIQSGVKRKKHEKKGWVCIVIHAEKNEEKKKMKIALTTTTTTATTSTIKRKIANNNSSRKNYKWNKDVVCIVPNKGKL